MMGSEVVDNETIFQICYYIKDSFSTIDEIRQKETGSVIDLDEDTIGIITEVLAATAPNEDGLRQVVANFRKETKKKESKQKSKKESRT